MAKALDTITSMIEPAVQSLGCELWGIERVGGENSSTLRVFIDAEGGVNIDQIERVSRQISAILDVEDPIHGAYQLEVSSPGIDRPLFNIEHYQRYLGETIKLRLSRPINGQRNWRGKLEQVDAAESAIFIQIEGQEAVSRFLLADIEKANLLS